MAISRFSTSSVAQGLPKYQKLWDGTSVVLTNAYESIATVSVGSGGATSVAFTSIPSTYKHLQVRAFTKYSLVTASPDYSNLVVNFNSDGGANYNSHVIRAINTTIGVSGTASQTLGYIQTLVPSSNSSYANLFGSYIIDILDYADTSKFKSVRTVGGYDGGGASGNGAGSPGIGSTLWRSTSAITSMSFALDSDKHTQYSHFALYGIKG